MARRDRPLFAAYDPEEVVRGIAYDNHPLTRPVWSELSNVDLSTSRLQKLRGSLLAVQMGADPLRGIGQLETSSGSRRFYSGSRTTLYGWDLATLTPTAGFTGSLDDTTLKPAAAWSFVDFGNWMLASNGKDPAQIAKDSLGFGALAGTTFTWAEILLKYSGFILALNTSQAVNGYSWSNLDNPEDWVAGTSKSAGANKIREMDGPIMAAISHGEEQIVFGRDRIARIGFRGSPFWFGHKMGLTGIGATGKQAVCSDGRMIYGVSRQGVWMTDTFAYDYIDNLSGKEFREFLQKEVNWGQASKICVWRNEIAGCINFSFPVGIGTEPSVVYRLDLKKKEWSRVERAVTAGDERRLATYPLMGTPTGKLMYEEVGTTEDGVAMACSLKTRPLMLGTPHMAAYVDEVQHLCQDPGSLEWRIGGSHNLDDEPLWTPWRPVRPNMETENTRAEGTYISLEYRSTLAADNWKLNGFLLYGAGDGPDRSTR